MAVRPVTNINVTYNVALVTVENLPNNTKIIAEIFTSLANQDINIDMISQVPPLRGTISISFTLPADDLVKALSTLNSFKSETQDLRIEIDSSNVKLQVYGQAMKNIPGVAGKIFTILADEGVEIKMITTSEVDISYLIYESDTDKAMLSIKKVFGLE